MFKTRAFLFCFAVLVCQNLYARTIEFQAPTELTVRCGSKDVVLHYRTSVDTESKPADKFAILIDGSPIEAFFSANGGAHHTIAESLWQQGYKIFEIKYPRQMKILPDLDIAEGFYVSCLNQGIEAVAQHAADIYDSAVQILGYDKNNRSQRLVGIGFSIGAVFLQSMAFMHNKSFDRIALTGVLVGETEKGCMHGLKQQRWIEAVQNVKVGEAEYYQQEDLFSGFSWNAFMNLARQVSKNGQGCCVASFEDLKMCQPGTDCDRFQNAKKSGICKEGTQSEFTAHLNFENQKFFKNSHLGIFEGSKTKIDVFSRRAAGNPAQAQYIAKKRLEHGAPTQTFFYENCGHTVIGCAKDAVKDMVDFLTNET